MFCKVAPAITGLFPLFAIQLILLSAGADPTSASDEDGIAGSPSYTIYLGYGGGGGSFRHMPGRIPGQMLLLGIVNDRSSFTSSLNQDPLFLQLFLAGLVPLEHTSQTAPRQIGVEYRTEEKSQFAFQLALNSTAARLSCNLCAAAELGLALRWEATGEVLRNNLDPSYPEFQILYLFYGLPSYIYASGYRHGWTYAYNTIDVGVRRYMRAEGVILPYLALGIGAGTCSGDIECSVQKGWGKIGLKIKPGHPFFFLEWEHQELLFTLPDSPNLRTLDQFFTIGCGYTW